MAEKYLKLKHEHFGKGQQYQITFKNNVKVTSQWTQDANLTYI